MREFLTSDHLANLVRMARTVDPRTVLFVEGDVDARFFERFVDHEQCIVRSAHDRQRAVGAIRILNAACVAGVLAVVDADFGRLTGTLESDGNVLFCDGHDLEIMLLQSPALERVMAEHGSADKCVKFLADRGNVLLAVHLARTCLGIGALRLVSVRENFGLTFEGLAFGSFVDRASLAIDPAKLVKVVLDKSQRHDQTLTEKLTKEMETLVNSVVVPWELACGHDCVQLLSFSLRSTLGTHSPNEVTTEILERELRLAFDIVDFQATQLFGAILNWETSNADYRVVMAQ